MREGSSWNGAVLKRLREERELTQTELAEKTGVKRGAVAQWEGNQREPSYSNLLALAKALGVECTAFKG